MKIIIDMNLAFRWAEMLCSKSIEAVHWVSIADKAATDTEIMAYARENGYTVLTNDLDFSKLHAFFRNKKPSVIQLRGADIRPESLIGPVSKALVALVTEIEKGVIISIDVKKTRFHLLPL